MVDFPFMPTRIWIFPSEYGQLAEDCFRSEQMSICFQEAYRADGHDANLMEINELACK